MNSSTTLSENGSALLLVAIALLSGLAMRWIWSRLGNAFAKLFGANGTWGRLACDSAALLIAIMPLMIVASIDRQFGGSLLMFWILGGAVGSLWFELANKLSPKN